MRTLAALLFCVQCLAFTPAIGVPDIDWGAFGEIDKATPAWPASWTAGTPSATTGYYYVDNTAGGATDSGNTYGHPGLPRLTIPEGSLAAGSFIYVHAGNYVAGGDRFNWSGTATESTAVWITGNPTTKPTLSELVHIGDGGSTHYLVFENFALNGVSLRISWTTDGHALSHVLVRGCELTGTGASGDGSAINIGISQTSDTYPTSTAEHVVIYDNEIHGYGDKTATDQCGVYNGYHTDYIWVDGNTIYDCGADGVAGSHYSDNDTKDTRHYYISRNTIHSNGENGIDIKGANYVVISQNTIYGPFTREQGWGIVLHYGASPSTSVKDATVIANRLYHLSGGIGTGGSVGCDRLMVIGNLIYDIKAAYAASADVLNGYCVQIGGSDGALWVQDNTFHDFDGGVYAEDLGGSDLLTIHGNVFSERATPSGYDIVTVSGQEAYWTLANNVYEAPRFYWLGAFRDFAYMQGTAGEESGSVVGDPLLNASTLMPSDGSAAIGVGSEGGAYAVFLSTFGVSGQYDFAGTARPSGLWDVGAFEYAAEVLRRATIGRATIGRGSF